MDGVWYVVGVMAFLVGMMGKKYIWPTKSPSSSPKLSATSSNTYPDSGDLMTELRDKWTRPLPSLPVHVDIPRLARKITVYSSTSSSRSTNTSNKHPVLVRQPTDQQLLQSPSSSTSTESDSMVIKELIRTLSRQLGEPTSQQENIDSHFMDYFSKTADPSQALAEFLEAIVGHDSHTARVLKACNQSVLAPGVLKLKFAIGNYFPYKDARGSWRIEIVVGPNWVTVEHLKKEKSFDESPQNYFEFTWSLKLIFDTDVQVLRDIELFVDDATLSDEMNPQTKKKVYSVLKPYFRTNDLIL